RTSWTIVLWGAILLAGMWVYPALQSYERGVAAVEAEEWVVAREHFAAAQARTPYIDTGVALAEALTLGRLAMEDPIYLPAAIATYEQLIAHEPGWPSNYANLAALYWQSGEADTAIKYMEQAHKISPQVKRYLLNLGVWHEIIGAEATASAYYEQLAMLPNVWKSPIFWQATAVRQEVAPVAENDPAWQALLDGDLLVAKQQFSDRLNENPRDRKAYLGLGISLFLLEENQNNPTVVQSLNRAKLLNQTGAEFWLLAYSDPTAQFLDYFRHHSTFGLGRGKITTYPTLILNRIGLPYDLLPTLNCLALDEPTSQDIALLQTKSGRTNPLIEDLFAEGSQGMVPCSFQEMYDATLP
ncbi:MAG: tetratricopeptide repeat protein, partial [Anaerolineales bacterium]|nr:tetratricopeptide repeat protein [Anaerolineales bacterium]